MPSIENSFLFGLEYIKAVRPEDLSPSKNYYGWMIEEKSFLFRLEYMKEVRQEDLTPVTHYMEGW